MERGCPGVGATERCGLILAAGQLDSDGIGDLAIGSPEAQNGGVVTLDMTSAHGGQPFSFDAGDLSVGSPLVGGFGSSLAIGDLGGDTSAASELLIGAPGESVPVAPPGHGNIVGAGAVYILVGTGNGPSSSFVARTDARSDGAPGGPATLDGYGSSIALAELGRGTGLDVVIGSTGETVGGAARAGSVVVLYSDKTAQRWNQNTSGIAGTPSADEHFGAVLTVADYGHGSKGDVAIGVPRDLVNGHEVAGSVEVMYGSTTGLSAANDQLWNLDSAGIAGSTHVADRFGSALR